MPPPSRGAPRPAPRDPNAKPRHALDVYSERTEQYASKSSDSNKREEYKFLSDTSDVTNDSLRRNVSNERVRGINKSRADLLPVFLEKPAESGRKSPSTSQSMKSLGSRLVGGKEEVKDIFATVMGPNSQLMSVVLPVSGLNNQADRRETMRLRKMTAQLAAGADAALKALAASAASLELECPSATPGLPLENLDGMNSDMKSAATPPHTPPSPEFRYPPQVRAPPAAVRVKATTVAEDVAAEAEKTAELVSASTVLAGLVQVPHDLSPPRARSVPPTAEGLREGGHRFGIDSQLGERHWGKSHTPPLSPWQGEPSLSGLSMPDESAAVDAEVARINRVAEKLGLRPLGIDKDEANWAVNAEMLGEREASPMAAFREASKLYRHMFYHLFRQEMNTSHPRGEALAYLWFSLDKFMEQVCSVAQTHHRNSMHEAAKRAELESTVSRLSSQLRGAIKSQEELQLKLAQTRLSKHDNSAPVDMYRESSSSNLMFRSQKWEALEMASANDKKCTRDAATMATLDSIAADVASAMKESIGYTKLSAYKLTHEEMVDTPLAAGDAAMQSIVYKSPGKLSLQPGTVAQRSDASMYSVDSPGVGVSDVGVTMRAEQLNAQVDRLKMAHLELRNQNETLRAEYNWLQAQTEQRVREVEQSNMVMKQQLYRAQALLRNKVLLACDGIQQHAADINNVLSFPEEPLWAAGEHQSSIEAGQATGNTALFDEPVYASGTVGNSSPAVKPDQRVGGGRATPTPVDTPPPTKPSPRGRKGLHMLYKGTHKRERSQSTSSWDPQTAMYVKVQYVVKDLLDVAMQRVDDAVVDAWKYPSYKQNLHRNHVRQVIFALRQTVLSHGMDFFCEQLLRQLEESVRETASETGDEADYLPSSLSPAT